jgi:NAD(P)-dependent dehydrogenase (short-subunit alcohol dehydrogenase family)
VTSFVGQGALVIGGSSGMGRGAARALAARGADVTITSRSADRLDDAVREVADGLRPLDGVAAPGTVRGVVCDLADRDSVRAAVARPTRLDHLVVTAAPGRGVTDREFFDGKFRGSQAACGAAAERPPDHGSILLTSGGLAVRPTENPCSSRARRCPAPRPSRSDCC